MRMMTLAAAPVLMALAALPAAGQVSARLHANIPIGRPSAAIHIRSRSVFVGQYLPSRYGAWQDYYQDWAPVTLYYYDGGYYDYPIVEYATPVSVFRFHDQLFFPPRDRAFVSFRTNFDGRGRYASRGFYNDGRGFARDGRAYSYRAGQRVYDERARPLAPRAGRYDARGYSRGGAPAASRGTVRDHGAPHGGSYNGQRGEGARPGPR